MGSGSLAADEQRAGSSGKGSPPGQRKILIVYGSETGNSQEAAEDIERIALRLHFETHISELNDVKPATLTQYPLVIIVVSTTGQGELPKNALGFWKRLLNRHLPPTCLGHVKFTTFGLGDSSYSKFNWAARKLHKRLEQLGATEFYPRGEADERHDEGIDGAYLPWSLSLRAHLLSEYPLPEGLKPVPLDVRLPPKILLEMVTKLDTKAAQFSHVDVHDIQAEEELRRKRADPATLYSSARLSESTADQVPGGINSLDRPNWLKDTPSRYSLEDGPLDEKTPPPTLLPIPGALRATVTENKRITPDGHWQDVRSLTMLIDEENGMSFRSNVGDTVVLYPKNFPADVQALIDHMEWNDVADEPFVHYSTRKDGIAVEHAPKHCYATPRSTLRDLLLHNYDITAIPKRSFFDLAKTFTVDTTHRDRLADFANPSYTDEFWDYTSRPRRSILEVLLDFPSVRIPYQWAPAIFPMIRGREYSIASGGALTKELETCTPRVELLVALVKYKTVLRKTRQGLASRYIETLKPGTVLHICVEAHMTPPLEDIDLIQDSKIVRVPSLAVPVLAIATGTGIAPIRSYFWERCLYNTSPNILFYGGRNKKADFYFADEWKRMNVEVHTAFSRDQKQKVYVQDVIRREYQKICDLFNNGVIVCLCGSAGKMPVAVRDALRDALLRGGLAQTEEDVRKIMRRTYMWEEVW